MPDRDPRPPAPGSPKPAAEPPTRSESLEAELAALDAMLPLPDVAPAPDHPAHPKEGQR